MVYRISGAFFFAAASAVAAALDRIGTRPKAYIIDFSAVTGFDSTAAAAIGSFARKANARGAMVNIVAARPGARRALETQGLQPPAVRFDPSLDDAIRAARSQIDARAPLEAA